MRIPTELRIAHIIGLKEYEVVGVVVGATYAYPTENFRVVPVIRHSYEAGQEKLPQNKAGTQQQEDRFLPFWLQSFQARTSKLLDSSRIKGSLMSTLSMLLDTR